jgi:SAM-dependent methyltransferase
MAFAADAYELKLTPDSSHGQLLAWLSRRPPGKVLDLGCSDGRFGQLVRAEGHRVVGVDVTKHPGVGDRVDEFYEADVDRGIPAEAGDDFDVVVLADVLEHTAAPERVLAQTRTRLAPGGAVLVSIPNFAHWYPRLRVASGRFDYDRRGILDRGHLRFFTDRSFRRLATDAGFEVRWRGVTGLPLEIAERGAAEPPSHPGALRAAAGRVDRFAARHWPALFAYQLLYELAPA